MQYRGAISLICEQALHSVYSASTTFINVLQHVLKHFSEYSTELYIHQLPEITLFSRYPVSTTFINIFVYVFSNSSLNVLQGCYHFHSGGDL